MSPAVSVSKWVFQTHLPVLHTPWKGQAGEQRWFPEPGGDELQIHALAMEINLYQVAKPCSGPLELSGAAVAAGMWQSRPRAPDVQMCRGWAGCGVGVATWIPAGGDGAAASRQLRGAPALPLTSSGTARALCHPPEQPQPCPLLSPTL